MIAIKIAVTMIASIYIVWLYYLAVMSLKAANDKQALSGVTRIAAYMVLGPGYALDFTANMLVMTVILLEVPREWLVTDRLSRHIKAAGGWRKPIAIWFCSTLLDRFDPSGCHCK